MKEQMIVLLAACAALLAACAVVFACAARRLPRRKIPL